MGNLYEFLCLYFALTPAPRIFTNLFKVPISILRRINIRVIIYLDNMLLVGATMEEISKSTDIVIFILQHLEFIMNLEKSVLSPTQETKLLGLKLNSLGMTVSLTQE